jgi:hypothetical protein
VLLRRAPFGESAPRRAVLLLTAEDDFNALASADRAGSVDGEVYQLGPRSPSHGVVAPYTGGETLIDTHLTRPDLGHRYAGAAPQPANGGIPASSDPLFLVRAKSAWHRSPTPAPPAPKERAMILLSPRRGFRDAACARVPAQHPAGLTRAGMGRQCAGPAGLTSAGARDDDG